MNARDYLPGVSSFAVAGGRIWISGSRRFPEYSEDGGETWKVAAFPDEDDLDPYGFGRIQFVDDRHGWLYSSSDDRRLMLRTTDGGRTWTPYPWFQRPAH